MQNQDLLVVELATILIVLPDTNEIQAAPIAEDSRKTISISSSGYTCRFGVAKWQYDETFRKRSNLRAELCIAARKRGEMLYTPWQTAQNESAAENDDIEMSQ